MLTLIVLGEPSIDFRCSWFVLSPRIIHGASFSWIFSFFQDNTEPVLLYVEQEGGFCPFLLQMPDDILLFLTRFLSIEDLFRWFLLIHSLIKSNPIHLPIKSNIHLSKSYPIHLNRMEQVCKSLRDLIVDYGVYKVKPILSKPSQLITKWNVNILTLFCFEGAAGFNLQKEEDQQLHGSVGKVIFFLLER